MELLLLPVVLYVAVVIMPSGPLPFLGAAAGLAFLGALYFNYGTGRDTSGDPHAAIGRGIFLIMLLFSASGILGASFVQAVRRFTKMRERPNQISYWLLAVVGLGSIFFPLLFEF